ncbi:tom1-like protein 2 isoform 2 [Stylonychia lemnae]|uniref:Tom1-like protein 2 isoform 2 n=1 Tax=Stylonychia lemnae TaxID=5949 RepID=A0A078AKE1_STYLE|nr:tom1-like protein 2 isoform 2 [Stylonychia lemnae]|eukprot:CDW82850.1 tom1-like protein 2 isoform 2 [Stylonychia lemnae]
MNKKFQELTNLFEILVTKPQSSDSLLSRFIQMLKSNNECYYECILMFKQYLKQEQPLEHIELTLNLLDQLMEQCDFYFHLLVGTFDFLTQLVKLLNSQGIKDYILSLIQDWGIMFQNDPNLPLFQEVFNTLKTKNVQFPSLKKSEKSLNSTQNSKNLFDVSKKDETFGKNEIIEIPKKYQKLLEDMNELKGNINLANMVMDNNKPDKDDTLMHDLIRQLQQVGPKLLDLITTFQSSESDEILKVIILVVDDLHFTCMRYEQFQTGQALEIFIPGESYLNTLINPQIIYERPDEKQFRQSIEMVPEHLTFSSLANKSRQEVQRQKSFQEDSNDKHSFQNEKIEENYPRTQQNRQK